MADNNNKVGLKLSLSLGVGPQVIIKSRVVFALLLSSISTTRPDYISATAKPSSETQF